MGSERHNRDMRISTISLALDDRIVINVGGTSFVTLKSTLQNVPNTKLANLNESDPSYDAIMSEYYFDRNPRYFSTILDYYRTGQLHFSHCMCGPVIKAELDFWEIDENCIAACCWKHYKVFEDEKTTLDDLKDLFNANINTNLNHSHEIQEHHPIKQVVQKKSWFQKCSEWLWKFMDEPTSSKGAQSWAIVMFLLIIVSISSAAMETHPLFRVSIENTTQPHLPNSTNEKLLMYYKTEAHPVFYVIDGICVIVFSTELLFRLICCPKKLVFFKSFYNIIDILCVLPFVVTFIINLVDAHFWLDREFLVVIGYLSVSSVLRIFRLFKMARHYKSFRLMIMAIKSSIRELLLLILLISMGMLIFSTLIYFAEFQVEGNFMNIPIGFWWSIITMTTVGYGDYMPESVWGYIVGGLCAISGTLITGLPIPIIASNFHRYYNSARFVTKITLRKDPKTKWINLDQRTLLEYNSKSCRRNGMLITRSARAHLIDTMNPSILSQRRPSTTSQLEGLRTDLVVPSVQIVRAEDTPVASNTDIRSLSANSHRNMEESISSQKSMFSSHSTKNLLSKSQTVSHA